MNSFEQIQALWVLGGVILLLVTAFAFYWVMPGWKIRREGLIPLLGNEFPKVRAFLSGLCQEVGLIREPTFVLNPLNFTSTGVVFGRWGQRYVLLNGGLVAKFEEDPAHFRAVLLHELAHLKNTDVDKTYFSIAAWRAFLLVAAFPFAISLIADLAVLGLDELGFVLNVAWRTLALSAFVYLMRNAVLRVREFYADVRASTYDGVGGELSRVIDSLRSAPPKWFGLRETHPDSIRRRQILIEPAYLFQMGFWEALGTGIAIAVVSYNVTRWLILWLDATSERFAFIGTALVFAPLAVGVVGLGAWRRVFAAQWMSRHPLAGTGQLGLGLGLGLLLGQFLSLTSALTVPTISQDLSTLIAAALFNILWTVLLLVSLFLFLRWIAATASTWLEPVATPRALHLSYWAGLLLATSMFAIWLAPLFFISNIVSPDPLLFLAVVMQAPTGALSQITDSPLTVFFLIGLWAIPLAASLWQQADSQMEPPTWAFLDGQAFLKPPRPSGRLRPGLAVFLGLGAGMLFCLIMAVLLLFLHLALADGLRGDTGVKDIFLKGELTLAILMQLGIALIAAARISRLRWAHAMCAGFVAACVMSLGAVVLLQVGYCVPILAFGPGHTCAERVDADLFGFIAGYMVNLGAPLTFPVALVSSSLFNLLAPGR